MARADALRGRRAVVGTLVVRDLRVRYAGSVLGYLWTVLDPLAMATVYWFVFSVIFKARDVGERPYVLFLVVGLLSWQWFSATLTDGSRAITSEARLVRSTNLPREAWVLRVVLAKGIEYVFSLPVIAVFCLLYWGQVQLNWRLVFIPLAIALQALLLIGINLVLAPVTALVRDTQRVVRIGLRVAFYLTPVIYGVRSIPDKVRPVLELNPMTGILELYRAGFFDVAVSGRSVAFAVVITLLILLGGWLLFARLESAVLKEI
ncbi:MAG: ABC transporter permease [Angustibacter sp.]